MGHRYSRRGGGGEGRRHAGDDLERNAGFDQRLGLFSAASEHERIAALQPHDRPAALGKRDEQGADQLLGDALTRPLADVDELCRRVDEVEHAVADEGVVNNHIGLGEQPSCAHCQ